MTALAYADCNAASASLDWQRVKQGDGGGQQQACGGRCAEGR
jgi:hypothetical protein